MASTDLKQIIAQRHREITQHGHRIEEEVQAAFDEIHQGARQTKHRFTLGDTAPPAHDKQD